MLPRDGEIRSLSPMTELDPDPSPEEELLKQFTEAGDRRTKRSEVLEALDEEWLMAARLVSAYKDLFLDAERLKVLNLIAGPLLLLTRDVLWEYLLLRVARLTDTPTAGRNRENESLSVLWLPLLFGDTAVEDEQKAELDVLAKEARRAADFARQRRNQQVAHFDLDRARDDVTGFLGDRRPAVAVPLEEATLEKMDRALEAVHRTLDTAFRYDGGKGIEPADDLKIGTVMLDRAIPLVEAVQFIDAMVDPGRGGPSGAKTAPEFLAKLEPELLEKVRALGPLRRS